MPKLISEINEIEKNINRPILLQIVNDVRDITGFTKDANIYYKGTAKQIVNKEGVMDETEREGVDFSHKDRILVEADTKYEEHGIYAGQPFNKEFKPILLDKELGIKLAPIYYKVEVEITLTFIGKDKLTLERWRSGLRRKIGQSIKSFLHRIDYTYPIEDNFFHILYHLYECKEKELIENETFLEWISRISLEKITGITNQIGEGLLAIVEQSQIGVTGVWNLTETPKINKMDTGDSYQSEISYTFKFSQPTSITLEYPIILNNTLIDSKYIPKCDFYDPMVFGSPERIVWGLTHILRDDIDNYPFDPVVLPCYDEWRPREIPLATSTIYQALIQVDTVRPTFIMDITDLGEKYGLATWVIDFLNLFKKDSLYLCSSPVIVSFYRNNNWFEGDSLYLNDKLYLFTKDYMEIYNTYHVRLSIYTDLTLLTEKAILVLLKNGMLTNILLETLGPELIDSLPKVLSDGSLRKRELWDFITLLKETNYSYKNGKEVRRFTVSNCIVQTRRYKDALSA